MSKKIRRDNKALQLIIILALVIALVTSGVLWIGRLLDARKFADLDKKRGALVTTLSSYLSNDIVGTENVRECYSVGQSPYNHGSLECQTATIFSLKSDPSPDDLVDEFSRAGAEVGEGHPVSGYDIPGYYFKLENGATCDLAIKLSSGASVGSAARDPLGMSGSGAHVAVSCGDSAKAKHYPYVD